MIIDFHAHIFPSKVANRAITSLESSSKIKAYVDGTHNALLESMKKYRIDYSVNLPIATSIGQITSINNFAVSVNKSGNILSFGSAHPLDENIDAEFKKLKDNGIIGIKLHPDFQGYNINSSEMIRLINIAKEYDLYIVTHAGIDLSFLNYQRCTPKMINDALPKISGAKLIIAHMGGHGYLEDCKKYLAGKNIWFDTSSMNLNSEKTLNKARDIILNHDENKILFGSDTPWFDQGESIEYIKQMNLGQGIEEKIFFKNAAKILNI